MFHLNFPIPESSDKISVKDSIVLIGSCFADNIGNKLEEHKFDCLSNPFGTIYNPLSISEILSDQIDKSRTIQNQGVFYHWQAHSKIAGLTEPELRDQISFKRRELQEKLQNAKWLIITLGSSFAYRLKSSGQIVANCHKVPQKEFTKELLEIEDMKAALSEALQNLRTLNPKLRTMLTVSPVRYFRDGLVENNRSKARLIEFVQTLSWTPDWIKYFPAYEIQMDELRDYRFYAKDRVHPSEEAIDYIWQKFQETYFKSETKAFVEEWRQIRASIDHRPIHPHSHEHQKFIKKTIDRLKRLSGQVDVSEEVSLLKKQLKA